MSEAAQRGNPAINIPSPDPSTLDKEAYFSRKVSGMLGGFTQIAWLTKQLDIRYPIRSAARQRHNMIYMEPLSNGCVAIGATISLDRQKVLDLQDRVFSFRTSFSRSPRRALLSQGERVITSPLCRYGSRRTRVRRPPFSRILNTFPKVGFSPCRVFGGNTFHVGLDPCDLSGTEFFPVVGPVYYTLRHDPFFIITPPESVDFLHLLSISSIMCRRTLLHLLGVGRPPCGSGFLDSFVMFCAVFRVVKRCALKALRDSGVPFGDMPVFARIPGKIPGQPRYSRFGKRDNGPVLCVDGISHYEHSHCSTWSGADKVFKHLAAPASYENRRISATLGSLKGAING